MLSTATKKSSREYRLRSFVRRDSRLTNAQEHAFIDYYPSFGLKVEDGLFDQSQMFGRAGPLILEIGFGFGRSLLECARLYPQQDFIGVETHKPGIGTLFMGARQDELNNLKVYYGDVIDVLEKCMPDSSLDSIQIFFPDPWPKRRHHARRLIQPGFVALAVTRLKPGGTLHLATDWEDYATHMMRVLSQEYRLENIAGLNQFAGRSPYRPAVTKFESRAQREGRSVWELQFQKK